MKFFATTLYEGRDNSGITRIFDESQKQGTLKDVVELMLDPQGDKQNIQYVANEKEICLRLGRQYESHQKKLSVMNIMYRSAKDLEMKPIGFEDILASHPDMFHLEEGIGNQEDYESVHISCEANAGGGANY
ncbi:MAG: hypothetical protein ACMXYK_00300 [Candidatus Woesearchaeota archaeon]